MEYIEMKSICKTYVTGFFAKRKIVALQDVNFSIRKGEIFGLMGPNGVGKTTLLNILISQLLADSGELWIDGKNYTKEFPVSFKKKINMCSGNPNFPWCMTVKEILKFYSLLYGLSLSDGRMSVERSIQLFELEKYADTRFDEISTGTKQRLALAKSLLNSPEILLLDEPTIGLDPDISIKIREFIKNLHRERNITIVLTTHYMKEAEELCDRVAFIKNGSILAMGTKDELQNHTQKNNLEEVFIELANN
ncbi:MAG: ABC transporter ATP-binding protein [Elusimicrobia bacterium HGW-Elusimicrobia-2]|nr:MAG: ABC transporter ATP-binding protein [Elusimicrobia bacterium HGW-Elusimicrobia-2]